MICILPSYLNIHMLVEESRGNHSLDRRYERDIEMKGFSCLRNLLVEIRRSDSEVRSDRKEGFN